MSHPLGTVAFGLWWREDTMLREMGEKVCKKITAEGQMGRHVGLGLGCFIYSRSKGHVLDTRSRCNLNRQNRIFSLPNLGSAVRVALSCVETVSWA
jgi:hypothetical protein